VNEDSLVTTISIQIITLVSFLAIALLTLAGWLAWRDLRARPVVVEPRGRLRLRRAVDTSPPEEGNLVAGADAWFDKLVAGAGLPFDAFTAVLLLICLGLGAALPAFLWTENPISAAVLMMIAMGLTLLYFIYLRRKRLREIQEQLPDVVDLVARTVRAGVSIDPAIAGVAQKTQGPLSVELKRCAQQLDMGLSLPAAFRALEQRIPLMDVQMFVTTIGVHRQTGGSLALTLERLAAVMRERLTYRRQIRATTAAGRMSAMLVAGAGPLLFLYFFLLKPEYIQAMLNDQLGQMLLLTAVVLEIIGVIWILSLMRTQN
jgi:tight adherence protein B